MQQIINSFIVLSVVGALTFFAPHAAALTTSTLQRAVYVDAATAVTSPAAKRVEPPSTSASLYTQSAPTMTTTAALASGTVARQPARSRWLPELTSSPQDIISTFEKSALPPASASSPSLCVFVFDRVNLQPVSDFAIYGYGGSTVGGPFVTNGGGFTRILLAPAKGKLDEVELEIFANYQPLSGEEVRLWPSNPPERRFRLRVGDAKTTSALFLPVVPVVRAEVSVYELPFRRMINVPVTLTPLEAVVRESLTLPSGAEDEPVAARFAIPAHEGDTYRVSIGENINTGPKDIGIFTVRRYRDPIELRVNLYVGPPPLEVITTEH
ncbi:MAG: hypothetical protein ACP5QZ_01340 [Candidatus Sumerlaeaceae bacterium]|jgi:hypothetical protein